MAAMIRARGMDTYVRGRCLSACTLMFLAGRYRILKDHAQLGFHAPTAVAVGIDGAQWVANERLRLVQAGVPDWFMAKAFAAHGSDMWFPTVEDLRTAGVITGTTNRRNFSPGRPNPQTDRSRYRSHAARHSADGRSRTRRTCCASWDGVRHPRGAE